MWGGVQGPCSRVLMCLAGWDHMIETGWYTDTFKSLARQRQTAHLWGRFCQSHPVKDLSVQPCAQADAADMFGGLGKKKIAAACVVPSSAESPQNVVECNVHDTRTKVLAQYSDVKNQEL